MYHIYVWAANKKTRAGRIAGQAAAPGACPFDDVGIYNEENISTERRKPSHGPSGFFFCAVE
jgi:hypothetical protein